jgi:SAM-dependent methyltransferase
MTPRDDVLADGPERRDARVAATYDTVAATYADHIAGELDHKPFDAWLLRRVADLAGGDPVADVVCGPGHVTRFLADAGADVVGFDLSDAMVTLARERYPGLRFEQGNLMQLARPPTADGWGAVLAWYSLVHLADSELTAAVQALAGPLRPGGRLAFATHVGKEVRHRDEWWDHDVDVDFVLHDVVPARGAASRAGLVDVEWYLRGPYAGAEVETERLYVLATKP